MTDERCPWCKKTREEGCPGVHHMDENGRWDCEEAPTASPHDGDPDPAQTIELDCPPGYPRPGQLIGAVIEGTGLEHKEACSTFFGNWTWDYSEVPAAEWKRIQQITGPRITALYERGLIRYGSW